MNMRRLPHAADPQVALDALAAADATRRPRATLRSLRAEGRDPFAMFRAEEALLIDGAWLGRVMGGGPLMFWDDGEDAAPVARKPYEMRGDVAVVRVEGPLAQRGWWCFEGYDSVERKLGAALDDAEVRAVVFAINSPGGTAAGCFEAVRSMRARVEASGKRVVAYSDEMAFSGGFALACVADEIVVPETGGVGSVGVIAGLQSYARALEKEGVDVRVITDGAEKADGHPALPISAEVEARVQQRVIELGDVFRRWVSSRRPLDAAAVKALEAGVFYGPRAVASRLADRVASLADVVASLRPTAPASTSRAAVAAAAPSPAVTATAPAVGPSPTTPPPAAPRIPMKTTLAALVSALSSQSPAEQAASLAVVQSVSDALGRVTGVDALDAQVGALDGLAARAAQHDAAVERAAKAEATLRAHELDALITRGRENFQLTPAQCEVGNEALGIAPGWARQQTVESLTGFLKTAPRVVPTAEAKGPAGGDGAKIPAGVAEIAAKAKKDGWASLSLRDRDTLTRFDPDLAKRLATGA